MSEISENEAEQEEKLLLLYTTTEKQGGFELSLQAYPGGYDNGEIRIDLYRREEDTTTPLVLHSQHYEQQGIAVDQDNVLTIVIENNDMVMAGGIWQLWFINGQGTCRCLCSHGVDFVRVPFLLTREEYALVDEAITYGMHFLHNTVDRNPYFLNIREQGPLAPERRTIMSQTSQNDPHTWISLWNLQTQRQYCYLNIMSFVENNQPHFSAEIIETGSA